MCSHVDDHARPTDPPRRALPQPGCNGRSSALSANSRGSRYPSAQFEELTDDVFSEYRSFIHLANVGRDLFPANALTLAWKSFFLFALRRSAGRAALPRRLRSRHISSSLPCCCASCVKSRACPAPTAGRRSALRLRHARMRHFSLIGIDSSPQRGILFSVARSRPEARSSRYGKFALVSASVEGAGPPPAYWSTQ